MFNGLRTSQDVSCFQKFHQRLIKFHCVAAKSWSRRQAKNYTTDLPLTAQLRCKIVLTMALLHWIGMWIMIVGEIWLEIKFALGIRVEKHYMNQFQNQQVCSGFLVRASIWSFKSKTSPVRQKWLGRSWAGLRLIVRACLGYIRNGMLLGNPLG
jgi:hypothetical protein